MTWPREFILAYTVARLLTNKVGMGEMKTKKKYSWEFSSALPIDFLEVGANEIAPGSFNPPTDYMTLPGGKWR